MFIEFHFGNFRSFRDSQKFSLEASPLRANDSGLEEGNVFEKSSLRLLKTKAVFGSNASGKSNLATAISAFTYMVSRSVAEEGVPFRIWNDRFGLITDWDDQPMFFQYLFLHKNIVYRYGFQILEEKVHYEWLFSGTGTNQDEVFMRSPDDLKVNESRFSSSEAFIQQAFRSGSELFRQDSLFLTAGALTGNLFLSELRDQIRNIITADGAYDENATGYAMRRMLQGNNSQKEAIAALLRTADTGVEDIKVEELPEHIIKNSLGVEKNSSIEGGKKKAIRLLSYHSRYNENGEMIDKIAVPFGEWESQGTSKIFALGALMLDALADGRVMFVDEFDSRLHPNLTLKIVQLFHSQITNPHNAQLIFITHDASLLRRAKLRRDQICFVNKNTFGVSSLANLIEYKGVRKDASYDKEYLDGNYSAVPYLDQMDWVVKEKSGHDAV